MYTKTSTYHELQSLKRERDILLNHLSDIVQSYELSSSDISNMTGLPIERCEKIIDDVYRLNQGKSI